MKRWACTDQTNFGNEYNELNIHKCQWQLFSFFFLDETKRISIILALEWEKSFPKYKRHIFESVNTKNATGVRLSAVWMKFSTKKKLPVTPYTSVLKYRMNEKKNDSHSSKNISRLKIQMKLVKFGCSWQTVTTVCRRM